MKSYKVAIFQTHIISGSQINSQLAPSESLTSALAAVSSLVATPLLIKQALAYFKSSSDPLVASLLPKMHKKSIHQERCLVKERDRIKREWWEFLNKDGEEVDLILTPPMPLPAFKNGQGDKASLMSAGYCFLWNIVKFLSVAVTLC